ncbi:hypothetical protein MBRA1_002889 [Malassezia brasiliensis]|uniref:OPA3-domain-containing protein n=1 Tax=Malassezia brasiliensis TaxID=1821822 RepID=A0AAF0DVI3_9BASI|nr:hypothetical protein MBRA1_002889 [Malassezia brasiliensis]
MATAKLVTLAIRTLAKPIATSLKQRATQDETFRKICIELAQRMHRTEMRLRANLVPGSEKLKVRPLNDSKAITNGANAISEGFLFFVAAALIVGETYRGSRSRAHARDRIDDRIEELRQEIQLLKESIPHGHHRPTLDAPTSSPTSSGQEQTLYSLNESVHLLWKLAARHGWLDNKPLIEEMRWALESDDHERSKERETQSLEQRAHSLAPNAANTTPYDENQGVSAPSKTSVSASNTDTASPTAKELGQRRAQAIIDEIRQQTSPTPVQLPRLSNGGSASASSVSSLFSWLPVVHDPRSYLQWISAPAFEALSPFS